MIVVLALVGGAALMGAGPAAAMRPSPDCAGLWADFRYWSAKYAAAVESHNVYLQPLFGNLAVQALNDVSNAGCG